jgi:peptide deformylase
MERLALRYYPDPILRETAEAVVAFDRELRELAEEMIEVMYRERGIGLAAPQVGYAKRLIIALRMADDDDTEAEAVVLVNPSITSESKDVWSYEEGCLSVPGISASVVRPVAIDVEYKDIEGGAQRVHAEGMFARVIQHEVDHLNGRLFIDYLSSAQKSLIKPKLKKLTEEYRLL